MMPQLKYVGITHQTASVEESETLVLNELEREGIVGGIRSLFQIKYILILSTCSRTEFYFETNTVDSTDVIAYLINWVSQKRGVLLSRKHFKFEDTTKESVEHLIKMANGLDSPVVGDRQIISQVKDAYISSKTNNRLGSVLERSMQSVFKTHKRIHNETGFYQGSTSVSYSALKLIADFVKQNKIKQGKILVIGAGEIIEDVLNYISKFSFKQISISNRTSSKAQKLAKQFKLNVEPWANIEKNKLSEFDAIITAVSNKKHLISNFSNRPQIYIDMAIPQNVKNNCLPSNIILKNIDQIGKSIEVIHQEQLSFTKSVNTIVNEELMLFESWLKSAPQRRYMAKMKHDLGLLLDEQLDIKINGLLSKNEVDLIKHQILNKLLRKIATSLNNSTKPSPSNHSKILQMTMTDK